VTAPPPPHPITPAIAIAIRPGRKFEAIKLHREAHGVDFKEANDAVDGHEAAARSTAQMSKGTSLNRPSLLRLLFVG
jgi:ribosomal protein L7/L12